MARKKEKQEPYIYEYMHKYFQNGKRRKKNEDSRI